jgi:cyclic pyranopterin phosphate synthase
MPSEDDVKTFTHVQDSAPAMVDIGSKAPSRRTAKAEAVVWLPKEVRECFDGTDIRGPKGAVFQTAILAGIMAAKRTSELIPLCHALPLDDCRITIRLEEDGARIECEAKTEHRTGVEMEALTGASVAALTLYDMCKAISHHIEIRQVRLLEKTGGKSDFQRRD